MKRKLKMMFPLIICIAVVACNNHQNQDKMKNTNLEVEAIFPKNELGSKEFFTGNAYPTALVESDTVYNTLIGNVYFEPGARSNWHSHPAGQILIITGGVGYHQIEGKPVEIIKKGDVVKCPPNVKHWHGASAELGLQQLYVIPNTEKGIVEWKEAVTDEQYLSNTSNFK